MRTDHRTLLVAALAATALAVPATAQAASPTVSGYAPNGAQVQADVSAAAGANHDGPLRQLPFTGFDLWFAAAGGLILALAGVALRRSVKAPESGPRPGN